MFVVLRYQTYNVLNLTNVYMDHHICELVPDRLSFADMSHHVNLN
jgi:hypothetical protein